MSCMASHIGMLFLRCCYDVDFGQPAGTGSSRHILHYGSFRSELIGCDHGVQRPNYVSTRLRFVEITRGTRRVRMNELFAYKL